MHQSTDKDGLYAGLRKYLMGRSSGYLSPGARRSMSKILGCPMLKWDMIHPDSNLNDVLQCMTALNEFWIRPLEDFDPEKVDHASWLDTELFRHLFLQYEIPEFLDNQIRTILAHGYKKPLEKNCLAWMVILGQGGSLQKASRVIGWDLPKSFSQKLFEVPGAGFNLEHGVAWALTLAVGGKAPDCLKQTQLISRNGLRFLLEPGRDNFKQFWLQTTRWMIRNRVDLDEDRWLVIRRWLTHINTEVLRGRQQFSWKGRTVKSVQELALRYDRKRKQVADVGPWAGKGWDWSEYVENFGECSVVELTSPEALVLDGEEMGHCVGFYAKSCSSGYSSIFSLRIKGVRTLTIEWVNPDEMVAQVYGYGNREPTDEEFSLVGHWVGWTVKVRMGETGDSDDALINDTGNARVGGRRL